jgi:hypothetical protein
MVAELWEALQREQHLSDAHAGDYATANPAILLTEQVEELIAHEHGRWISVQQATHTGTATARRPALS